MEDPAVAANAFYDNAVKRAQGIDQPVNAKAERRAAADKAYAEWQSRYGEGVRERKTLMDQRMRDRQQRIDAERLASKAESAPRPGQPASEPRTVHDVFRDERIASENAPSVHDAMRKMSFMEQAPNAVPQKMTASSLPPQNPFKDESSTDLRNASIVQDNLIRQAAQKATLAGVNESQRMATERNLTDTKAYHNQTAPTYGKRNDGTYGVMHDPKSPQAMKERSVVMDGINNSKSGNPFQDFMDSSEEEEERKRRQQKFVSQSKASPFYNKNLFG